MAGRRTGPGLASLLAVGLVFAGCDTSAPSVAATAARLSPSPTSAPTTTPVASVMPTRPPLIPATVDTQLAVWARDWERMTRSAEDRLVLGHTYSEDTVLAYDPTARVTYQVPLPAGAKSMYPYFADGLRVSGTLEAKTGKHVAMFGTADLTNGTFVPVKPLAGYAGLQIFGHGEGHGFGYASSGGALDSPFHSRAIVVDLGTGKVTDLSPAGVGDSERFEARGVAGGKTLVAWFAATPEVSAAHGLELVDLATGDRTTVALTAEQLTSLSDAWDEHSLQLLEGRVFGYFSDSEDRPAKPFEYDIATGTVRESPCEGWLRLDPGRVVCFRPEAATWPLPDRMSVASIYDLATGTLTDLPWLHVREKDVQAVADGFMLLVKSPVTPQLYDARTGSLHQLDVKPLADFPGLPEPSQFAIVGHMIVAANTPGDGWTDGHFDPRVWPLP